MLHKIMYRCLLPLCCPHRNTYQMSYQRNLLICVHTIYQCSLNGTSHISAPYDSTLRQHFIHPPLIRTAECTPLYQLIKLINILKEDKDDIILSNVE